MKTCVLVDGPYETETYPEWIVCYGDEEGEPLTDNKKEVYRCPSQRVALETGKFLAKKHNLELINETSLS